MIHMLKTYYDSAAVRYRSDEGATLVEYALLVALIAIVLIGAIVVLQGGIESVFSGAGETLQNPGDATTDS